MKILVLDLPGLHTGYLGCYGNDWIATPNIDRLACESVVFDRHIFDTEQPAALTWDDCSISWQEASAASVLDPLARLDEEAYRLPGHGAVGVDSLKACVAQVGAALGRKLVVARFPPLAPPWDLPLDLLDSYCEEDDQPWPNPPHGVLENRDDLVRLQNTYAAVVTYVDAQLGALLEQMRRLGHYEDTLICLTAFRGLPLGEHNMIGWPQPAVAAPLKARLHEELVHLPLILRLPGGESAGLRTSALTQPVDVVATVFDLLKTAPAGYGHSLLPLIRAEINEVRPYACSAVRSGGGVEWALRTRDWALLLPAGHQGGEPAAQAQLYVKPDDRWEVNDVRQRHLELAEELEAKLRVFASSKGFPWASGP